MNGSALLPEFDHETRNTRRLLEIVPDDRLDYKPHEKSWTLLQLATHVATVPGWTKSTFDTDGLDISGEWEQPDLKTAAGLVRAFDEGVREARVALEAATAETLQESWTLRAGENVLFTKPKGDVFRFDVLNHMIHHRAQMSVYLRLLDVAIPGMYGPSADETMPV